MLSRVLKSEGTWRYVDAYVPRVFGLFLHSLLLYRYGAQEYALPAWLLGVYGLFSSAIPDPHSYIIVRGSGRRAARLLALTTPALIVKALLCIILSLACVACFGRQLIIDSSHPILISITVLIFGAVEANWAVLGTVALATGSVQSVARRGLVARALSATLICGSWVIGFKELYLDISLAFAPVMVTLGTLLPIEWNLHRSSRFTVYAVKHYSIWSQAIGLVTSLMFQAPATILGALPLNSSSTVGAIAYTTRILQAALQPLQILQSLVIKELLHSTAQTERVLKRMRRLFRIGAIALLAVGATLTVVLRFRVPLDTPSTLLLSALCCGVSISAWYRYELAVMLAQRDLRSLFVLGYLPAIAAAIVAAVGLTPVFGIYGLSISILVGWLLFSTCWKWCNK